MASLDLIATVFRVVLGTFFIISGYHKCFVPEVRSKVFGLFDRVGVHNVYMKCAVTFGELLGGFGLLFGCFTYGATAGLIVILVGAVFLDTWKADVLAKQPRDFGDYVAKVIYMPETLLIVMLATLLVTGPGYLSFDAFFLNLFR